MTTLVGPSLANALPGQNFQFERQSYFVADRVDHVAGSKPVFNLAVGLRDSWGKLPSLVVLEKNVYRTR
jgi:glutaminyl-tRNA synthetase